MSDSKALRDAAAILLDQANKLEGKPSTYFGQNLAPILEMWNSMLKQFAAEDASVASEHEIGLIVSRYKPVIDAAHRERWPSNLGPDKTFWLGNYKTAAELRAAIRTLMQTEQYKAWAAHPANANYLPKGEPLE